MTTATDTTGVHDTPACGDGPMLVGGGFVGAAGGQWSEIASPRALMVIGRVPRQWALDDVDPAVTAARSALERCTSIEQIDVELTPKP
jgi:hypothetical protein